MSIFSFLSKKILSPERPNGLELVNGRVMIAQTTINCISLADIYIDCKFVSVVMFDSNNIYWLKNKTFRNCIFDRCNFKDMADHGNFFDMCVFERVNFQYSVLGYDNSKYANCIFRKVKFGRFIKAIFENCIFEDCDLDGVDFNASSFNQVSFFGYLHNVWFRGHFPTPDDVKCFGKSIGNYMIDVSFKEASLHNIDFSDDCKLSNVILPAKGLYAYFGEWRKQLDKIVNLAVSEGEDIMKEGMSFYNIYSVRAQTQNEYILNIDDLKKEYSYRFIAILLQCSTKCT